MHTLTTLQTQFLPTVGSSISDSECTLTPKSPGAVISHSSVTSPSIPVILNALIMAEGNMYLPQQRLHAQLDEEKARGVDSSSISKVTSINTSPSLMVETTTSSSIVSVKTSSFFIESADVNQDDDIIDDEKHAQEEHISLFSSTQSRPPPANIESAVLKHLVPDIINERDGPPSSCIIEEQEEEKHDDDKSQQSASTDSSDAGDEDSEYSSTGASQTLNAQISYPSTTQLSTLAHQSMLESIVHVTSNISVVNTISSAISQSSFLVGLGAHQVKAIGNGIWSLQKHGARRPSWPAALDLSLNVLRQQFQFPHHTMEQLRVASAGLTIFSPPTSGIIEGVQIRPIEIRVNREELLKFERSGSRNTTGNAATFPVPEEDTVNDPIGTNSGYKLTGEWVLPDTKPEFPKHIFSGGAGSNPNLSRRSSTTATRTSEAATSPLFTPGTSANTNMSSDAKIVAEDKSLFSWAMDNLWWSKGTNNCTDGKRRSFETKQQPISSMVEQLQRDHIARKNASGSNIDLEAASSPPKTSAPRRKIIYYLHGGAYVFGNSRIYRPLTSYIAKATGMDIFVVNYRLAPESPFPASIHDAFAGYLHLIDPTHPAVCNQNPVTHVKLSGGNSEEGLSSTSSSPEENSRKLPTCIHPDDIIFMGDSAGGGLCVALMSYLKNYLRSDLGDPMIPLPSAAIILSPWLDIGCKSASWEINKDYDWLPSQARNIHENVLSNIPSPATMYVFGQDSKREINIAALLPERFLVEQRQLVKSNSSVLKLSEAEVRQRAVLDWMTMHPLVSPLYSDLTAMPPILLQIGSCELLVDESFTFAAKYYKENQQQDPQTTSIIRHEEYKDMVHVFQAMSWLPISALAMKHINHFISEMEAIYDDNDCFADDDNEDHQHHHRVDFYWKADKEDGEKVKINSFFKRKRHGNY